MAGFAAIIPSLLGGLAGLFNKRPPSLDPSQHGALDELIRNLMPTATGTPTIDPIQQALMYGNIAASRTGADTAVTHALSSRGLGTSGLLGAGLIQNQNVATQNQNQANLGLQQQAIQQKQLSIQDILGLLNVNNTPGQSGAGGFMAGLAPILSYSIQSIMPVNTDIRIPFLPQESITSSILTAIQLANEQHNQQQQRQIQQQQVTQQGQVGQAQIEEAKARAGFYGGEAQKNQIQVDMMKRAQQMFGVGQPEQGVQPQGQPAPSPQQPLTAPTTTPQAATPQAPPSGWLPQNTPPQMAPLVSAMIPKDLNDQEKNVIEAGAQTGRLKAMQSGDLSGYLADIRSGIDNVVTNRNKNVENQPIADSDRSNFSKNVLPSFENLSPAQKKGAQAELDGVKTRKELDQLEGRLMQQDNQALQKDIAQKNIVANRQASHENALDSAGRGKIVADTAKFGEAYTQAQIALRTLDAAQNGDDLATRMVPTMEVLGINMTGGIKRISPTEADAARVPVSWVNRFNQWVDSKASGASDATVVAQGKRLMHDLTDVKYAQYLSEAKSTALNYHLEPKDTYVMNNNGESTSLADALKGQPKGAKEVGLPEGAIRGTLNGKPGYALNGVFHPL
jgi:Spy/CpxP family protein refolding chaperone